ncbi:MAG: hypothetical protein R2795_15750 [Saprospiraceae bacterium]
MGRNATSVTLTPTGNGEVIRSQVRTRSFHPQQNNLFYALEVVFTDGCGNVTSEIME